MNTLLLSNVNTLLLSIIISLDFIYFLNFTTSGVKLSIIIFKIIFSNT